MEIAVTVESAQNLSIGDDPSGYRNKRQERNYWIHMVKHPRPLLPKLLSVAKIGKTPWRVVDRWRLVLQLALGCQWLCQINEPLSQWLDDDFTNWKWQFSLNNEWFFINEGDQWQFYIPPCRWQKWAEYRLYKLGGCISQFPRSCLWAIAYQKGRDLRYLGYRWRRLLQREWCLYLQCELTTFLG